MRGGRRTGAWAEQAEAQEFRREAKDYRAAIDAAWKKTRPGLVPAQLGKGRNALGQHRNALADADCFRPTIRACAP